MIEGQRILEIEVLDPAHFFLIKCPHNPTVAFGWINETSAGNFNWWNMWSFTLHWPWIRYYRGLVETS